MTTITYEFAGDAQERTFTDEASADLFIASLVTRRDAFLFAHIVKTVR